MHTLFKTATLALAALLVPLSESRAASVLDKEYVAAGNNSLVISSNQPVAQSFTVGLDGFFDFVEVQVMRSEPSTVGNVTLSIVEVNGGVLGAELASLTRAITDFSTVSAFLLFDFADFAVEAGDTLAIRMVSDTAGGPNCTPACWTGDSPGGFDGGTGYAFDLPNVRDFGFRTFIEVEDVAEVPEPSALGLIFAALAGLAFATRRGARVL
jgi:hypothetical protein